MPNEHSASLSRRRFLQVSAAAGVATAVAARSARADAKAADHTADGAVPARPASLVQRIPTFCAMCGPSAGCGIWALVRDGKFVGVEGMKESPLNRGRLCAKAHASVQWVYSPERLRTPLRRIGAKGEGKFEAITWNQALDLLAEKLKEQKAKYGPESLAILSPAHRTYSAYLYRFLLAHGSPNYGHSGICAMQRAFAYAYTVGGSPRPDVANSKLVVIWAKQPVFAGASKGGIQELLDAKERGVKIVAIKPTMEPDVAIADVWVPVRPGTDAALVLAMLHVVVGEDLYDHEFVAQWTYGFDRLVEHVKQHTPEWAEKITGVPAEQIRSVARLYATTKPACIQTGNGFEHAPSCADAIRGVAILSAICGNLDRRGGDLLSAGPGGPGGPGGRPRASDLRSRVTQDWIDKLVAPEFPRLFQPMMEGTSSAYYRIIESVLTEKPYPVRTIIAPGTQPSVTNRGPKNVIEALKKVDFYVVLDVTRTAELNYADLVIPVASMYEIDHPFESTGNWIMARNKVIAPLGDYKSDYEFWIELGVRMGYAKDFWNGSLEECMRDQLEAYGVTMAQLREHPTGIVRNETRAPAYEKYAQAFATRSTRLSRAPYLPQGKVAIYNTTFAEAGFHGLPEWVEPPESPTATPELFGRYPLVFSDFHTSKVYTASWQRNVPYLREIAPDPTVQLHPDAAKARGIANGDWVVVESPHGHLRMKAQVFPGIRPDTAMALHGWWQACDALKKPGYPLTDGGANTNNLYSTDSTKAYDPLVTAMTSQTLVQIRKA